MCNEHNTPYVYETIRRKHPILNKMIIELMAKHRTPKDAIRLRTIKLVYVLLTLRPFPEPMCDIQLTEYVLSIPNIVCFRDSRGESYVYSIRK